MTRRGGMIWQRMGSVRLLLGSVLLSTLVATTLVAALAGFASRSLPQAVSADLARSSDTSISIYGAFATAQAHIDQPAVPAALRRAFGTVPFAQESAVWSDPFGLPASSGRGTVPLIKAAAISHFSAHAVLTAGSWPVATADGAVEAAIPATVAQRLHLRLGHVLRVHDRLSGAVVRFLLTGTFRPTAPASRYWSLDLIAPSGTTSSATFITYGPLVVAGSAFSSGRLAIDGATWLATLASTHIGAGELTPLADRIAHAMSYLTGSPSLGGLQASSGLPDLLSGIAAKLVVARSLLLVSGLELLLLAGATLVLTVRMLASQRETESSLLAARGASRWSIGRIDLAEALVVGIAGAVGGGLLGSALARLLIHAGQLHLSGLTIEGTVSDAWLAAGVVVVMCTAIMVWPALRPKSPGAARVRTGRAATAIAVAKVGGDLGLVVLALLAGWQLRHYSVISAASGGVGVDPVLSLAPALVLAAATVLPARLVPLLARAADRLAANARRLALALPSWEISRRAARQTAPMLLVVLAVGTGTLALGQHSSWRRSAMDQAAFAVGADVRADLLAPLPLSQSAAVARGRGVTAAMPVTTSLAASNGQVLALDARSARHVALLRADQSVVPSAALWRKILPPSQPRSIALPGRPERLAMVASFASHGIRGPADASVAVSVQDSAGIAYSVPTGTLPADGQAHELIGSLSPTAQAMYPLRLLAVSVSYAAPLLGSGPAALHRTVIFTVRRLAVSPRARGAFGPPIASGAELAGWRPLSRVGVGQVASGSKEVVSQPVGGQLTVTESPIQGGPEQLILTAPVPFRAIPGIATTAFLQANQLRVGDSVQVVAAPIAVTVHIVTAVANFPTITDSGGGLIVDEAAAQDVVAAAASAPLPVSQWWLATRSGAVPPGLPAGTSVSDRARLDMALLTEPMSAIVQQAVQAVAAATAFLAVLGLAVSIAGTVRERRSQSALLAALGVRSSTQTRLLCAEVLTLVLPAALIGLLLGTVLAHLLVPAVTVTASGGPPVPSALVEVPLRVATLLLLAVTALPLMAAAATAAYRPDPAAVMRAAEAT